MWCPSVSLAVWSNAWLAGAAAPDDVLDALMAWAPGHSVTAYDAVAAGRTGLPWPDVDQAGPMALLQTVRAAARTRGDGSAPTGAIAVLLPVPGDVRGLEPGTRFAQDALAAEQAMTVSAPGGDTIGLVPEFDGDDILEWSVYSVPACASSDAPDLGEAEYALRSAVRSAAETLGRLELAGNGCTDPRTMVEELLRAAEHHRVPDHAPSRATRVLSTAAHVDAIITVSAGHSPIGAQSASEARLADDALRPLASVVRAARAAAVNAILHSAWR